jgi:hypothetical protein
MPEAGSTMSAMPAPPPTQPPQDSSASRLAMEPSPSQPSDLARDGDSLGLHLRVELEELLGVEAGDARVDLGGVRVVQDAPGDGLALEVGGAPESHSLA